MFFVFNKPRCLTQYVIYTLRWQVAVPSQTLYYRYIDDIRECGVCVCVCVCVYLCMYMYVNICIYILCHTPGLLKTKNI